MPRKKSVYEVPVDKLRWRLDPATLSFETTEDLKPLKEIIGQKRGVEAFRFGMGMDKPGYNVFVTGTSGTGRMSTVKKLLEEMAKKDGGAPDDLCYVNNFKNPEAPILMRLKAGMGSKFKQDVRDFLDTLKKDVPRLFESQEYLNRKKEIMQEYEKSGKSFFKDLELKVKEEGFALVDVQVGQIKRPEVMPLVDGNPVHIDQVEAMVEKGRFPKDEFEGLKKKHAELREGVDQIFLELRDLQKGVQENVEKMDRLMFEKVATQVVNPVKKRYDSKKIDQYLDDMLEDMTENLQAFLPQAQSPIPGMPMMAPEGDPFHPYQINLLVENGDQKAPPVLVESYPTYRNLFRGVEDRFQ
jgi:ATP-dependent Lon protease